MADDEYETVNLLRVGKIVVSVLFDTVEIKLICKGDYEAQVLFEDLTQRLEAGEEISIEPQGRPDGQSAVNCDKEG